MNVKSLINGILIFSSCIKNCMSNCQTVFSESQSVEDDILLYMFNDRTGIERVNFDKEFTVKQYVHKTYTEEGKKNLLIKKNDKFYQYEEYMKSHPDINTLVWSYDGLWEGSPVYGGSKEDMEKIILNKRIKK